MKYTKLHEKKNLMEIKREKENAMIKVSVTLSN